jgi:tetratricopeptide (TPR) repeat protein
LVSEQPDSAEHQDGLAKIHNNLGLLYHRLRDANKAKESLEKARTLKKTLAAKHPDVPAFATDLAGTHVNLGNLYYDSRKPSPAVAEYDEAIRILTAVLQRESRQAQTRESLCNAYQGRAKTLAYLQRHGEALNDWDRALKLDPDRKRPWLRTGRALAMAHLGDHVRATAEIKDVTAWPAALVNELCDAARVYALCIPAVHQDAALSSAEREILTEQYGKRAFELLRQANAADFFRHPMNRARLRKEPDFAPLKSREDFQKLLSEVERTTDPG